MTRLLLMNEASLAFSAGLIEDGGLIQRNALERLYYVHPFGYRKCMDEKPKHWWWNGRWGRLARRDIKVFRDGDRFRLEAWTGGVEGEVRTYEDLDESQALALAEDMAAEGTETLLNWRDMVGAN